ncbi:hypothetical protein F5X68DRAFT_234684 [Plectosphaerella plurivora]|uniref:Uncharacterized protein n=1 Tax=Plectosphaerella plurivora TaxID=936078 RepID=A0A9P9A801_9PEZI|nr:hypothetical protein F5X68DRAFT_234684 [Plectosphaerella plurivora]
MASAAQHKVSPPWRPGSLHNAPILAFTCLAGSLATSGLAFLVIFLADGQFVERWPVSPSVYLSILATLTGLMLRTAFQVGAETQWWTLLLSRPGGVKLGVLHGAWELAHDATARFKIGGKSGGQPILRSAGILLILLAGNGPLLQRAVSVNLVEIKELVKLDLPIRRHPMWNLTVLPVTYNGHVWSSPPYQDEFAEVVTELNQRRPVRLRNHANGCPVDSKCLANVTVASFSRTCVKSYVPIGGVPTLQEHRLITLGGSYGHMCRETGPRKETYIVGEKYCQWLKLQYQLGWETLDIDPNGHSADLPWLDTTMPPFGFNYTNYFREDVDSSTITVQKCNFTTAFVNIPIEITESTTITMRAQGDTGFHFNNGVESIPAIVSRYRWPEGFDNLGGIRQAMADLYSGYVFFDEHEGSQAWRGGGPRQFLNLTPFEQRPLQVNNYDNLATCTFSDPLANFTETLHELALRYATKTVPSTPKRLREMETVLGHAANTNGDFNPSDHLHDAVSRLKTPLGQRQTVSGIETRSVNIYKVDYLFAAVAVGITSLTTVLVALLFTGWRKLGRRFSMSPIELAKAFDAPLLANVGSNSTGDEISNCVGGLRLRYGEVDEGRYLLGTQAKTYPISEEDLGTQTAAGEIRDRGAGRLLVGKVDVVSTPVVGKTYS